MGRKKEKENNSTMSIGNFVWTPMAGIPKKMKWPGKIVGLEADGRMEVYCKSDNTSYVVKSQDVSPFPGCLSQWKETGRNALKKLPTSKKDFLDDINWALNMLNHGNDSTAESSSNIGVAHISDDNFDSYEVVNQIYVAVPIKDVHVCDAEIVIKDAEMINKDAEMVNKEAEIVEMVKKDAEILIKDAEMVTVKKDEEIVNEDAEMVNKDAEMINKDAEMVNKEAEIVEMVKKDAEILIKDAEMVTVKKDEEIVNKDAEMMRVNKDAEMLNKEAEMVIIDSEIVKKDAEIVIKDAEMVNKDAEMINKDAEMVNKEAEIVEMVKKDAEILIKDAEMVTVKKDEEIVNKDAEMMMVNKDAEMLNKDAEMLNKEAEMVIIDSEIEKKDAEIVIKDAEIVNKDAEMVMVKKDKEIVNKDAEMVMVNKDAEMVMANKDAEMVTQSNNVEDATSIIGMKKANDRVRKRRWKRIRCPDPEMETDDEEVHDEKKLVKEIVTVYPEMETDDEEVHDEKKLVKEIVTVYPEMETDDEEVHDEKKLVKEIVTVTDSSNDSDVSESYPMLSKAHSAVEKTPTFESEDEDGDENFESEDEDGDENFESEDEDDDEKIDEECILRDKKHPEIFITAVKKEELSKSGKIKKHDRVYNAHHPCPFCEKIQTNFSHHVLSLKHSDEPEVKEILELDYSKCINPEERAEMRKERKRLIDSLRRKGVHKHNLKVLKNKKGEIILERRLLKSEKFDIEKYGACPSCYGWILIANIHRHQATCHAKPCNIRQSKNSLITQSQVITGRISEEASNALVREVFSIMTIDKVGKIAKTDKLIISLGNQWMLSNLGNRLMRKYYASSVMRLSAKLLISLRDITGKPNDSMDDFIAPVYYESFAKAALICSKQDTNDEEDLRSPSNSIKLGYDIKRMASAKLGAAIVEGDSLKQAQAENFLTLMNMSWTLKVTKLARLVLTERSFNSVKQLPLPEDLQKMVTFMITEIGKLELNDVSYKTYRRAAVLALSRITLYNRRRCHEVQAINLEDYKRRKQTPDEVALQMSHELTEFERELLNTQEVVMTRGKGGKGVPVIIPKDVFNVMEYLTNEEIRQKVGIPSSRYLFANSNAGVFRGYDSINAVKKEAGLKLPSLVKTSNMRKYMATMMQSLDITENQRQWILDHLGHTFDVHRMHYRQTSDLIERVHISKLLLIQDFGMVNKFVGKKLDDIQLEDIVPNETEEVNDENADTDSTEDAGIDDIDEDYIPDLPEEVDIIEERLDKKKCREKKAHAPRQKWSEDDVKELEELFSHNLKNNRCPRQAEIQRKMKISQKNGGNIHNRKVDNIKKKVSNMIQKLKNKS